MPARFAFWPQIRKDPASSRIIANWRALTGGKAIRDPQRRTLIACSGGADSAALAIALAAASKHLVLAHILHDMRPAQEAHADRDATRALAQKINIPCVVASVTCRDTPGNAEANYRAARYQALSQLAIEHACPFIATGHHRDDQIETMLMRLVRGSGFSALAGIRASRPLTSTTPTSPSPLLPPPPLPPLTLIRPMLTVTHEDAQRLCTIAGYQWQEDATNLDPAYARGLIRTRITPALAQLNPRYASNISRLLKQLTELKPLLDEHAASLFSQATRSPHTITMPRELLASQSETVLGAVLHLALKNLTKSTLPLSSRPRKQQALSAKTIAKIAATLTQPDTGPKHFQLEPLSITLTAHDITIAFAPHENVK